MELQLLLVAVATSTSIHTALEPDNVLRKLRRLATAIRTGKIEELPMKGIDTRPKSYGLGLAILAIVGLIAYFIASLIDPSVDSSIKYSIAVVLISELVLGFKLDKYHVEIERLTQSQKKK